MSHRPAVDPALLRRLDPLRRLYARYFQAETQGWERVPPGPALLVGNHSGGLVSPETVLFVLGYYERARREGRDAEPLTLLGHDVLFRIPVVSWLVRAFGAVPAEPHAAAEVLRSGGKVVVFPGGDHEAMRPSRDRDRIDFGGREGFVELALRCAVPVVPFVTAGAHDVWHVFARGERLARWLRLDRALRIKACPVGLALPWGLFVGPLPVLPCPARVRLEVLEPLRLEGAPGDPQAVAAGYRRVTGVMQEALTRLAAPLRGAADPGPPPPPTARRTGVEVG